MRSPLTSCYPTTLLFILFFLSIQFSPSFQQFHYPITAVFNSSYSSSCVHSPCDFHNASIWVNNTIPGPNDSVLIVSNYTPNPTFVISNNTYVAALFLHFATVKVINTTLHLDMIGIEDSAILYTVGTAVVQVKYQLEIFNRGSLNMAGSSMVSVSEFAYNLPTGFVMDASTSVSVLQSSYLMIQAYQGLINGSIHVDASAKFGCLTCTFACAYATFGCLAVIPTLTVLKGNITFGGGLNSLSIFMAENTMLTAVYNFYLSQSLNLSINSHVYLKSLTPKSNSIISTTGQMSCLYGVGTITILSSTLAIYNNINMPFNNQLFHGTIEIGGISTVSVSNMGVYYMNFVLGIRPTEFPNVQLYATGLNVYNMGKFAGTLHATGSGPTHQAINIQRATALNGCIVSGCGITTIQGAVTCTTPYIINSTENCVATVVMYSSLTAPRINISSTAQIHLLGSATTMFHGAMSNNGNIFFNPNSTLFINGDYIHGPTAMFNLTKLSSQYSEGIRVNGSVWLNGGGVEYSLAPSEAPNPQAKSQYQIVCWSGSLYGTFGKFNQTASALASGMNLLYSEKDILLGYSIPPTPAAKQNMLWLVLPITVGALGTLVTVCLFVIKNQNNKKYKYKHISPSYEQLNNPVGDPSRP